MENLYIHIAIASCPTGKPKVQRVARKKNLAGEGRKASKPKHAPVNSNIAVLRRLRERIRTELN